MVLACGGLDSSSSALEDATHAEAAAAGWTLPEGASHIYTHDFSLTDLRSTHLRYVLSEQELERLIAEHRQSAQYTELSAWEVPSFWPVFSDFGPQAVPPAWWQPTGSLVFRTKNTGSAIPSGSQVAFDASTLTVFKWVWQREHWTMSASPADEPLVIQLGPELSAQWAELDCEAGQANRQQVGDGQLVFANAPVDQECRLKLRGGAPRAASLPQARQVVCRGDGDQMTCSAR